MNNCYQPEMRKQLVELRKAAGMSQQKLADKTGISRKCVIRIERGLHSPRIDTLEWIATALGCELVISFKKI